MPSLLSYTLGKYGFTEITLKPSDIFWFSFSQDFIKRRLKIGDEVSNLFSDVTANIFIQMMKQILEEKLY